MGKALVSGFFLFGLATGILIVMLWPLDSCIYANPPAVLLGDWVYTHAIEWIGDPHSDQAHYTIPWLLRVPQVYAFISCALYGALGLVLQWLYNEWASYASGLRSRPPIESKSRPAGG